MPTDFKRELVDYILAKSDKEAVMQVNAAIAQWNSIVGEYEFKIQNSRFTPPDMKVALKLLREQLASFLK